MSMRVLFFFPHNLFAARSGAHQQGLEMIAALAELGCDVTLFSSKLSTDEPWVGYASGPLTGRPCRQLILHEPTVSETAYMWAGRTSYHVIKRWAGSVARKIEARSISAASLCTESMRRRFGQTIKDIDPDVIFMNYAWWDGLFSHERERHRLRVVDTHDLASVAIQIRAALEVAMPDGGLALDRIPPNVLREDYFDGLRDPGQRLQTECDIYDKYDVTFAVSEVEAAIMRQRARNTQVVTRPVIRAPVLLENTYNGMPLYAAGMNPFNVHGYAYFVLRVLPTLRARMPDFMLDVTGSVCEGLTPVANVRLRGRVDRLDEVYRDAPFVVNPVYGGTGQQVKIVDAMAHGVPVIALDRAAAASPIRHGENGLIARNAEEFAEHVATLWHDRQLCRRLGANARAIIEKECSPQRLREILDAALRTRAASPAQRSAAPIS